MESPEAENFPAAHSTQAPASSDDDFPRSQSRQSSGPSLPADEYLPFPQLMQSAAATMPSDWTYLPASQSSHSVSSCAPLVEEYLPAPQATHPAGLFALVVVPYLPAAQSSHAVDRSKLAYLPVIQSVHESEPAAEYLPAGGVDAHLLQYLKTAPSMANGPACSVRESYQAASKPIQSNLV